MKIFTILSLFAVSGLGANAQTYTVSALYSFPAANTAPTGITVDSRGNIYAAGSFSTYPNAPGIAQIFPPNAIGENGSAVIIAGGEVNGFLDGTGSAAEFSTPEGMAADSAGNIYLADVLVNENATLRKIVPSTGVVTTLSGLNGNTQLYGSANGVAVNASGAIYVSAVGGSTGPLAQFAPGGTPILIPLGSITDMQNGGQSVSSSACFGVAVDSSGVVYVTVISGGPSTATQLYVLKISGTTVTQLFALPLGTDSQLEQGLASSILNGTVPITVDAAGNLYVGWYGNLYLYNSQTGPTQVATIGGPIVGLATDSAGRVYVASGPPGYLSSGVYGPGLISVVAPPGVSALPSAPTPTPTPTPTSTPHTQFINISARAFVGTGSSIAIAGFTISGSANEQVLIRGVGPSLSIFSVNGVLAQPVLTLFNSSGTQLATNTGWGTNSNPSQVGAAFMAAGAFTLPSGSADSALLVSLAPGSYTAQVSGLNNTTGNALIEVYQVPSPTPMPTP
jgi:hypothetical protein